jgi:membrane protease YdiL (CAAX protease family)
MKIYKALSLLFLFVVPNIVGFLVLYQGQETKVSWSFNGIFILIILFLLFFNRFRTWYKEKKQAHETARNLGQISHTTNFTILALGNFFFLSIPFLILILLEQAVESYEGSIAKAVGYLLLSFFISQFFDVLHYQSEQSKIREKLVEATKKESEALAEAIKEQL